MRESNIMSQPWNIWRITSAILCVYWSLLSGKREQNILTHTNIETYESHMSKPNSVNKVTDCVTSRTSSIPNMQRFLSLLLHSDYIWDPLDLIQWVPGALSPDIEQLEHEDDHTPPSSAETKNAYNFTSTLPYTFMTWHSNTGTTLFCVPMCISDY
jgi:hypothetical protein